MTGQLQDLQQQPEFAKKELKKETEENKLLEKQMEQEIAEKVKTLERFPSKIDQVKTIVMKMVYSHKQLQLKNLVEAIQEMSLNPELQKEGMSFCLTRYKSRRHTTPNCPCVDGFTKTKATMDLSRWQGNFSIRKQEISVFSLFENGLLSKFTITNPNQLNSIDIPWRLKVIVQDLLALRPLNIGFVVLEILSVPSNCQNYLCNSQHYVLVNLIWYGTP